MERCFIIFMANPQPSPGCGATALHWGLHKALPIFIMLSGW